MITQFKQDMRAAVNIFRDTLYWVRDWLNSSVIFRNAVYLGLGLELLYLGPDVGIFLGYWLSIGAVLMTVYELGKQSMRKEYERQREQAIQQRWSR